MKPLPLLVVILGAILAAMGIIFNAPPYIEEPVRVMLGLGFAGALAFIFRGPLGQAIAAQLKGDTLEGGEGRLLAQLDEMTAEMQAMRDEVGQLHERLDFTERLLTQQASRDAIGPMGHGEKQ
ncbi:MAG TPA: hypothetical protein VJU15_13255 [Gemmatimonadales bacterium]|nr:hypothetical protein [Gemmatimonadales bacterium]